MMRREVSGRMLIDGSKVLDFGEDLSRTTPTRQALLWCVVSGRFEAMMVFVGVIFSIVDATHVLFRYLDRS